jgi:hypothetical protein
MQPGDGVGKPAGIFSAERIPWMQQKTITRELKKAWKISTLGLRRPGEDKT